MDKARQEERIIYWKRTFPKYAAHADNEEAMTKLLNLRNLTYKESKELWWLIEPRCANGHVYNHAADDENNKNIIGTGQPCDAKASNKCLGTIKTTTFYFCDGDSCKAKHNR